MLYIYMFVYRICFFVLTILFLKYILFYIITNNINDNVRMRLKLLNYNYKYLELNVLVYNLFIYVCVHMYMCMYLEINRCNEKPKEINLSNFGLLLQKIKKNDISVLWIWFFD